MSDVSGVSIGGLVTDFTCISKTELLDEEAKDGGVDSFVAMLFALTLIL